MVWYDMLWYVVVTLRGGHAVVRLRGLRAQRLVHGNAALGSDVEEDEGDYHKY